MTESTVTRRRSYRGQLVRVTLRDGRTVTGHLDGWGPQILAVRPTDGGLRGWKVESFGVSTVAHVVAVTCDAKVRAPDSFVSCCWPAAAVDEDGVAVCVDHR